MSLSLGNRRLVIAYNPHSSRALDVQAQVFDRLKTAGYAYETLEVRQASLQDNVARLAPQIQPNDVVLSAAGDGSAHATFQSVMAANQPGVMVGFLAFGNFNDIPHTFNSKKSMRDPVAFLEQAEPETVWPLAVTVDGAPLRSALLYVTIGWTARAAGRFDDPQLRSKLIHKRGSIIGSLWNVGWYYLKTRRGSLLPPFRQGEISYKTTTDLLFANGPMVARLFRSGKRYYRQNVFLYRKLDVRRLVANIPFLVMGLVGRMSGEEVTEAIITFDEPSQLPIQCDGEVVNLEGATNIQITKTDKPLVVLRTK